MRAMKHLYLVAGFLCVGLGIIGAVLPIMPTVPFLLLAAFCFARSNPAFEQRLLDHPRYGPPLRLWREKGAIGRTAKIGATIAFMGSIALGFFFTAWPWPLVPLGIALVCGSWIWSRPDS